MNDPSVSECSSGCESGWTIYFEQSFHPPYPSHPTSNFTDRSGIYSQGKKRAPKLDDDEEQDEEEDLSMVSDASSGLPILREDEHYGNAVAARRSGTRSGTNNSSICSKVADEPEHGELVVDGGGRRWRSVRRRAATAADNEGENRRRGRCFAVNW
ncbi:hypothetical protein U1Q18_029066 [Sarracenia purpurea var. burkii]